MTRQVEVLPLVMCCILNHSAICSQLLELYPECQVVTLFFCSRYLSEAVQLCIVIPCTLPLWGGKSFSLCEFPVSDHIQRLQSSCKMVCDLQAVLSGQLL